MNLAKKLSSQAELEANKSKNRVSHITCYDENRVKLSSLNGGSYINATVISVNIIFKS